MKTLKIIIERSENNYSAFIDGIDGITITGNSMDEIKMNMCEAINIFIEESQSLGCEIPEELIGEYELVYS